MGHLSFQLGPLIIAALFGTLLLLFGGDLRRNVREGDWLTSTAYFVCCVLCAISLPVLGAAVVVPSLLPALTEIGLLIPMFAAASIAQSLVLRRVSGRFWTGQLELGAIGGFLFAFGFLVLLSFEDLKRATEPLYGSLTP